jgi:hypothetical protein
MFCEPWAGIGDLGVRVGCKDSGGPATPFVVTPEGAVAAPDAAAVGRDRCFIQQSDVRAEALAESLESTRVAGDVPYSHAE